MRGEHLHFRCSKHKVEVEGMTEGQVATFRCSVKGCDYPAKAYWYKGAQYQQLQIPATLTIDYSCYSVGSGIDSYDC